MSTSSFLKTRIALVALFGYLSAGCTSVPEDGILPKDYEWAYGWWRVTKEYPDETGSMHKETYDMIINGSTYQSEDLYSYSTDMMEDFEKKLYKKDEVLYPVYTTCKIPFTVCEDEETLSYRQIGDDELALCTSGTGDYDRYIILNKTKKTVDGNSHKVRRKINPVVVANYKREYESAIANYDGGWKKGDDIYYDIRPDSTYILTKNGYFISYRDDIIYYSDEKNDQISFLEYTPDGEILEGKYKRYDSKKAKKYIEEQLASKIVGHSFSRAMHQSDKTALQQTLHFDKYGNGSCYTRNVNARTGQPASFGSEQNFKWRFNGHVLELSFSNGEKSHWKVEDWDWTGTILVCQEDDSILSR